MAFNQAWVETDPDGTVITVSQLDDWIRNTKIALRERLEGDPAVPDLTGLIEVGTWPAAPKPRKGAARVYVDTAANIAGFGATKREDGRLAVASDTNQLYHVATAGVVAVVATAAAHTHAAGDITAGTFADARIAASNVTQHQAALALDAAQIVSGTFADARIAASNVTQHQAALSITWAQVNKAGSSLADLATRSAGDLASGNLAYARLPTGAGTWDTGVGNQLLFNRNVRFDNEIVLGTVGTIRQSTADASDNQQIAIYGGGASGDTRGGSVVVNGNEFGADPGSVLLTAGNVAGGVIKMKTGGSDRWEFKSSALGSVIEALGGAHAVLKSSGDDAAIQIKGGVFITTDDTTGFIICYTNNFGRNSFQIDHATGADETSGSIYDVSGASLKRISRGANDSGGAGFRVLRIPN